MNKDIPDYKYCKKLKELGWTQNAPYELSFYWIEDSEGIWLTQKRLEIHLMTKSLYAPTIGEIMDVLPSKIEIDGRKTCYLEISKYTYLYVIDYIDCHQIEDKSLPNALAKMLIRVISEGYLDLTGPKSNVK